MKILVASNNQHKIKEFKEMFASYDVDIFSPKDLNIDVNPVEDGNSYEANSLARLSTFKNKSDTLVNDCAMFCELST